MPTMTTVVYFDPNAARAAPRRLTVPVAVASAMVRAGTASPLNPAELSDLLAGGPLDSGGLTEVVLEHGRSGTISRLWLPASVAAIAASEGVAAGVSAPIATTPTTPWPKPAIFFSGTFPANLVENPDGSFGSTYSEATFADTGPLYYVRAAGNDTTGDGLSAATAFRSVQKAIDTAAAGSRVDVGAGRFAPFSTAKNISVSGVPGATFVGELLTEADITWGALASGRQTATLASGAVSGFVDTTLAFRGYPQVSEVATSAAAIATKQAGGKGGIFRSTPSQVGAADGRSLAGSADTTVMLWRDTAAAPITVTGTARLFVKGVTFVGGASISVAASATLVMHECQHLGAVGQNLSVSGRSLLYRHVARGCAVANQDVLDYGTTATAMEIDCLVDQGGTAGADNCSTIHGGIMLRINGTYLDASRPIHDNTNSLVGTFGATVGGIATSLLIGGSGDLSEGHYARITFVGTPSLADHDADATPNTPVRAYWYDNSLAGKTVVGTPSYRTGPKPTTDATLFAIDPSMLSTLFKDTAGSSPVTASGDAVQRINNAAGGPDYATVTSGTVSYVTDGTRHWLLTSGGNARLALNGNTAFDESTNVVLGLDSTDTSSQLIAQSASNVIGDCRTGTTSPTNSTEKPGKAPGAPTYHVDNGASLTTRTAVQQAAMNGAPHVLSIRGANLAWVGWMRANLLNNATPTVGYDGRLYGLEISRATTPAGRLAREQAMAAKAGAVLA